MPPDTPTWVEKYREVIDKANYTHKGQLVIEKFLSENYSPDSSDWDFSVDAEQLLLGLKVLGIELVSSVEYSKLQEEVENLRQTISNNSWEIENLRESVEEKNRDLDYWTNR